MPRLGRWFQVPRFYIKGGSPFFFGKQWTSLGNPNGSGEKHKNRKGGVQKDRFSVFLENILVDTANMLRCLQQKGPCSTVLWAASSLDDRVGQIKARLDVRVPRYPGRGPSEWVLSWAPRQTSSDRKTKLSWTALPAEMVVLVRIIVNKYQLQLDSDPYLINER